jgi:hypothetical protein
MQTVLLAGRPVNTLTPEASFLFLCSHGSKHMFERLGWVCDIAQFLLVASDLNWPLVLRTARGASALRQIILSVRLAEGLLGARAPAGLPNDSEADALSNRVSRRLSSGALPPAAAAETLQFSMKLLETAAQRLRYFSVLYVTPSEAEYRAVRLPPWLHFLYYPYRPMRLFWKHAIQRLWA